MVLCTGVFIACDKEYESVNPPIETPEEPEKPDIKPSIDNIIQTKIGDINMIVGTNNWYTIRRCNGKYIAAGVGGYITSSSDGTNWPTPKSYGFDYCHDVIYGNGKYIVVGSGSGSGNINTGRFSISSDGVNWSTAKSFNVSGKNVKSVYCITYGNGKFIAICMGGDCISSSDGETWKYVQNIGGGASKIIYGNSKYVASGQDGNIYVSSDGSTWSNRKITTTGYFVYGYGVAYGNGKYVVLFSSGECAVSSDGETWTKIDKIGSNNSWNDLAFSNNAFIAVNGSGECAISFDGLNWEQPFKVAEFYIRSVTGM